MDERKTRYLTAAITAIIGGAAILIGIGNPRVPAGAQYFHPPVLPNNIPRFQPVDVTHTPQEMLNIIPNANLNILTGLSQATGFPKPDKLGGPTDFLLVQTQGTDTTIKRDSPYAVTLISGTVLASVKRPSQTGMLSTPVGDVAFSANSDAFISFEHGVLRIRNVDGMGQAIRIQIHSGPLAGRVFSIQPGYELVLGDHKLTRTDVRPGDGILRRNPQLFADGFASLSQYSVESALQHSSLVSTMSNNQATDPKAKKIISDMSKMAAVLNQINGGQGFTP